MGDKQSLFSFSHSSSQRKFTENLFLFFSSLKKDKGLSRQQEILVTLTLENVVIIYFWHFFFLRMRNLRMKIACT